MPATLTNDLETAFTRLHELVERVRNPEYDSWWLGIVSSATQAWQRFLIDENSYYQKVFFRQIERDPEQDAFHARYVNAWLGSALGLLYFLPPAFAEAHAKEHTLLSRSIQQARGLLSADDPCFDPKDCGWAAYGFTAETIRQRIDQMDRGEGRPAKEVFAELRQRKQ